MTNKKSNGYYDRNDDIMSNNSSSSVLIETGSNSEGNARSCFDNCNVPPESQTIEVRHSNHDPAEIDDNDDYYYLETKMNEIHDLNYDINNDNIHDKHNNYYYYNNIHNCDVQDESHHNTVKNKNKKKSKFATEKKKLNESLRIRLTQRVRNLVLRSQKRPFFQSQSPTKCLSSTNCQYFIPSVESHHDDNPPPPVSASASASYGSISCQDEISTNNNNNGNNDYYHQHNHKHPFHLLYRYNHNIHHQYQNSTLRDTKEASHFESASDIITENSILTSNRTISTTAASTNYTHSQDTSHKRRSSQCSSSLSSSHHYHPIHCHSNDVPFKYTSPLHSPPTSRSPSRSSDRVGNQYHHHYNQQHQNQHPIPYSNFEQQQQQHYQKPQQSEYIPLIDRLNVQITNKPKIKISKENYDDNNNNCSSIESNVKLEPTSSSSSNKLKTQINHKDKKSSPCSYISNAFRNFVLYYLGSFTLASLTFALAYFAFLYWCINYFMGQQNHKGDPDDTGTQLDEECNTSNSVNPNPIPNTFSHYHAKTTFPNTTSNFYTATANANANATTRTTTSTATDSPIFTIIKPTISSLSHTEAHPITQPT